MRTFSFHFKLWNIALYRDSFVLFRAVLLNLVYGVVVCLEYWSVVSLKFIISSTTYLRIITPHCVHEGFPYNECLGSGVIYFGGDCCLARIDSFNWGFCHVEL